MQVCAAPMQLCRRSRLEGRSLVHRLASFRYAGRRQASAGASSEGAEIIASSGTEGALAEVLSAAKNGRIDRALSLAEPLAAAAGSRETPRQLVARECSDRAARSYVEHAESRDQGIQCAAGGATFQIPGRGEFKPADLAKGFWLRDVSVEHDRSRTISRLARASLALRGLESREAVAELQGRSDAGDAAAAAEVAAAARDYQLVGRSAAVGFRTCRSFAVLQSYIGKRFSDDKGAIGRAPLVFSLMLKASNHFNRTLGDAGQPGPLDAPGGIYACPPFQSWAEEMQAAVGQQMAIVAELTSEAATSLIPDPQDARGLLDVAQEFFQEDCPLIHRRKALAIFQATAERLRDR